MSTKISQADPIAEVVKNLVSPAQSGLTYVGPRYAIANLASGNANAFAFAIQNPEGVDCLVLNAIVRITTAGGTATSVLDVDIASSATGTGTGTGDSIIDGLDLNQTGEFDRHSDAGTNGGKVVVWNERNRTNDFITGKILVANAASLAGKVIIQYLPLE